MKAALRTVIKEYPGLTFNTGKIILHDQPRCIFHYRNELREYGINPQDPLAAQHLLFMLNYMDNTLSSEISSYYAFMESQSIAPGIEYDHLWMAFRPGDLIYTLEDGIHRALKLKSMERCWGRWVLETEKIANDGTSFGYAEEEITIGWYDGYKPLKQLCAFPLRYHSQMEDISQALRARGKKYCKLHDIHQRYYAGSTNSLFPFRRSFMREYSYQSIIVSQRRSVVEYLITRSRSRATSLWTALSLLRSDHHTRSYFPQIKPRSGREMRNQKVKARKFPQFEPRNGRKVSHHTFRR